MLFGVSACSSDDGKPSNGTSSSGGSSGGGANDGGTSGGKKKNAEGPCASNDECESNTCFMGNNQSFCSVPCTPQNESTVCVAPFTGSCNNRGFCKRD